ncbi:hypothetical protein N0B31_19580 [Salinirubellus salinus]|uniref:Uncharacterized protein n=1 Tax=Salinirubellus salinus TaxID=1364945 RepID=A0A9E7R210_9EURY|nr:hypothetical protein [Salinirubellus salinus]UWM54305.1 hypothetical protein N0B31_19580 [Salinirubellus salinus]
MNRHSRPFVSALLALLLLLAGCGGLDAGPGDRGTPSPSATPTPTPDPTATPTPSPTPTPTATPAPERRDLRVEVGATDGTAFEVTVLFVDDPVERVTVRYQDGTERTYAASTRGDLPEGALVDAVALVLEVPVERAVRAGDDATGGRFSLGIPTAASDVVYVVTVDGRVHDWDVVTCGDGDVTRLDLTVHEAGVSTGNVGCAL